MFVRHYNSSSLRRAPIEVADVRKDAEGEQIFLSVPIESHAACEGADYRPARHASNRAPHAHAPRRRATSGAPQRRTCADADKLGAPAQTPPVTARRGLSTGPSGRRSGPARPCSLGSGIWAPAAGIRPGSSASESVPGPARLQLERLGGIVEAHEASLRLQPPGSRARAAACRSVQVTVQSGRARENPHEDSEALTRLANDSE